MKYFRHLYVKDIPVPEKRYTLYLLFTALLMLLWLVGIIVAIFFNPFLQDIWKVISIAIGIILIPTSEDIRQLLRTYDQYLNQFKEDKLKKEK